jgi:enoyl-CoA hydratase/carnithine racemase
VRDHTSQRLRAAAGGALSGIRRVGDPATLEVQAVKGGTMSEVVQCEVRDGVALLTLNRPERLNAWTGEMEHAYFGMLEECGGSEEVRVIVVTGAGRGFCAGADMQELQAIGAGDPEVAGAHADERRAQTFPLSIRKPIIAAINGPCAGIGLVQALMCDMRFAAEGAKITTAFARRGLVAEHGISWILPRLVGPARALDLLLSGRVLLAEEAAALGLVNRVLAPAELLDETLAYARELAVNCSPASMATMKHQVYAALEQGLPEALAEADGLMLESFTAPDFVEGVTSFLERRDPRFAPLPGEVPLPG